ncbi:MAG: NAD(+)/NADH kinase [Treponema sp.]|uniref:NAD(+)/NADH kinase n=1 Tax=Treponema sp. TaxID=166 RepID=UPI003FA30E92
MGKNVIIILTTYKPHVAEIAKAMIVFFQKKGIHADVYEYDGVTHADPVEKQYDFAVSLGGDGTVLFTARYCAPKKIPVFPINLGEFGFIAGIEPEYWEEALSGYLAGSAESHERLMLSTAVYRDAECIGTFDALNDVVVSGAGIAKLINLAVSFNGVSFGTYRADGVIVSSPTGSTAYSAASGGPIMDPTVAAFVLTPISAFSLSNRPVVLPASGVMHIDVLHNRQKDVIVSIDGQESFPLCEGDRIEIRMSPHRLTLVGCSPAVFYTALRSKLVWSGSPLQD